MSSTICNVFNISSSTIDAIVPIGGMTNKNYKITINNKHFVLRIPGNGTEEMINRHTEKQNALYAHELGLDAEIIYFNEDNGIRLSLYIDNVETLSPDAAKRYINMKLTTDILCKLHSSTKPMSSKFDIYHEIEKYHSLISTYNATCYPNYNSTLEKIYKLKGMLHSLDVQLTPCHNDLVAENLLKSNNKMYLIDWEYAGMNDPMWDLASHILECDFTDKEEAIFLQLHFNGEPEDKYIQRILIHKIFQDFLWSL